MDSKVIQEFKGIINGVEFDNKEVYASVEYILEYINEKFGELYNYTFIEDMRDSINRMYLKYDEFSFSILENSFIKSIDVAEEFETIKFTYDGLDWKIENLNKKLSDLEYNKSIELPSEKPVNIKEQCHNIENNKEMNSIEL